MTQAISALTLIPRLTLPFVAHCLAVGRTGLAEFNAGTCVPSTQWGAAAAAPCSRDAHSSALLIAPYVMHSKASTQMHSKKERKTGKCTQGWLAARLYLPYCRLGPFAARMSQIGRALLRAHFGDARRLLPEGPPGEEVRNVDDPAVTDLQGW